MLLSLMLRTDEDSLLCDLAETYHVYDLDALPVLTLATLACGLKPDARIMQKLSGINYPPLALVAMHIADGLTLFRYGFSDGKERPYLFLENLEKVEKENKGFKTAEEFEKAWKKNNERES